MPGPPLPMTMTAEPGLYRLLAWLSPNFPIGAFSYSHGLEAAFADPEIAAALSEGAALALVPLVRDSGRAARANISIDAGLLDAIDEAAAARGLTRSAFLASAAREKIAKEG